MIPAQQHGQIVVVRLGAMGDVIHALPAVATLKASFPERKLIWVVKQRWIELLEGNPFIDELMYKKANESLFSWSQRLRSIRPDTAIDLQGLIQSAVVGRLTRPEEFWGFDRSMARESLASLLYTRAVRVPGPHRVERNLQLAGAAGATKLVHQAWLPDGRREGVLPRSPFVLANPFAGWAGKQWPITQYAQLARHLAAEGIPLVMNVSNQQAADLPAYDNVFVHTSSIAGLIHATREAVAVVGVDSGPLHLAAALSKPGVAVYGPTDPVTTGPFGGTFEVLRAPQTETTYSRHKQIHPSMNAIAPSQVVSALMRSLQTQSAAVVPKR